MVCEVMKPALSRSTLQVALVLVGGILAGVAEAPGIDQLVSPKVLHWLQLLGVVLGSSQLIKRVIDYAPSEVTVVGGDRVSKP